MENKPKHTPMARLAVRELKHTYELCHADMYGVPQGPALLITADKEMANVLAAAPELLEACRIALDVLDKDNGNELEAVKLLKSAIEKASAL